MILVAIGWRLNIEDTVKALISQGPTGTEVDTAKSSTLECWFRLMSMSRRFSFFLSPSSASYWWWYRTATEGAAGV
jgi:hypothetical protein